MTYRPNENTSISTVEDLLAYVQDELRAIAAEFAETTALDLRTTHVEPKRPRDGMIVSADGTDWDPGSGAGIYAYLGGTWTKL